MSDQQTFHNLLEAGDEMQVVQFLKKLPAVDYNKAMIHCVAKHLNEGVRLLRIFPAINTNDFFRGDHVNDAHLFFPFPAAVRHGNLEAAELLLPSNLDQETPLTQCCLPDDTDDTDDHHPLRPLLYIVWKRGWHDLFWKIVKSPKFKTPIYFHNQSTYDRTSLLEYFCRPDTGDAKVALFLMDKVNVNMDTIVQGAFDQAVLTTQLTGNWEVLSKITSTHARRLHSGLDNWSKSNKSLSKFLALGSSQEVSLDRFKDLIKRLRPFANGDWFYSKIANFLLYDIFPEDAVGYSPVDVERVLAALEFLWEETPKPGADVAYYHPGHSIATGFFHYSFVHPGLIDKLKTYDLTPEELEKRLEILASVRTRLRELCESRILGMDPGFLAFSAKEHYNTWERGIWALAKKACYTSQLSDYLLEKGYQFQGNSPNHPVFQIILGDNDNPLYLPEVKRWLTETNCVLPFPEEKRWSTIPEVIHHCTQTSHSAKHEYLRMLAGTSVKMAAIITKNLSGGGKMTQKILDGESSNPTKLYWHMRRLYFPGHLAADLLALGVFLNEGNFRIVPSILDKVEAREEAGRKPYNDAGMNRARFMRFLGALSMDMAMALCSLAPSLTYNRDGKLVQTYVPKINIPSRLFELSYRTLRADLLQMVPREARDDNATSPPPAKKIKVETTTTTTVAKGKKKASISTFSPQVRESGDLVSDDASSDDDEEEW